MDLESRVGQASLRAGDLSLKNSSVFFLKNTTKAMVFYELFRPTSILGGRARASWGQDWGNEDTGFRNARNTLE